MVLTRSAAARRASGPYAVLTDLPNELLDMVLESLDDNDLVNLAFLCTQLHSVALPMFFDRNNFDGSSLQLVFTVTSPGRGNPYEILKPLRLSFSLKSLNVLDCIFSDNVGDEAVEVQRLMNLLDVMSSVRFDFRGYTICNWTNADLHVFGLMDTLHTKSCKNLEFCGLCIPLMYLGATRTNLRLRPVTTLESVTLSVVTSPGALFLDWLIQSLNQSPTRVLNVTSVSPHGYAQSSDIAVALLDRTDLPHLTELNVISKAPFAHLLAFLYRHPTIVTLLVDTCELPIPDRLGPCALPQLTTLITTPVLARLFLSSPGTIPALSTVELFVHTPSPQYHFDGDGLTAALCAISTCQTVHHLSLKVSNVYRSDLEKWMDIGITSRRHTKSRPVLHNITHLTLFLGQGYWGLSELDVPPPKWLKILFPDLETFIRDDGSELPRSKEVLIRYIKKLKEGSPALAYISFSNDDPPQSLALYF